jgi:hypothetical protein
MIKIFQQGSHGFEAIQFKDNAESFAEIRKWVGNRFYYDYQTPPFVFLEKSSQTCEGVRKDDWIILSTGYFNVYSPDDMKYAEEIRDEQR